MGAGGHEGCLFRIEIGYAREGKYCHMLRFGVS